MIISYPAPRVAQLDGHILDSELTELLKEKVSSIFRLHSTSKFSYNHHPELYDLILKLVIFNLTVGRQSASYGLSLQNLKLSDSASGKRIGFNKKSVLFSLIILEYLYKKTQSYLYTIEDDSLDSLLDNLLGKLKKIVLKYRIKLLTYFDNTIKVLNLVNFILFLVDGRHASLIYRLLNISLTPLLQDLLKFNGSNVNYEFQNRQLVWNVMTEFLVFILPVLQLNKWRSAARRMLNTTRASKESKKISEYANLPVSQCAICHDNNKRAAAAGQKVFEASGSITNPYVTNCGHIYCYVCLASRFNYMDVSGNSVNCLRCFEKLKYFQEYGVFEEGDEANDIVDKDAIIIYQEDEDEDEDEDDEDNDEGENSDNENRIDIVSSLQDSGNSEYDEDDEEEDDDEYFEEDDYDDGQFEDEYDDFEEAMDL